MKAVIYARYSSDNQREESIEGQLRECMEFASRAEIDVIGNYIDRALTAKTDNRPEFQRMIKDSYKHAFDCIIVWKLDRFSRNRYDSAHYKALLRKNGVKVVSAMESISEGSEGILLESVLEGMAEYYSAELAEKVVRGMKENTLKGLHNGGQVTFDYKINEERRFERDEVNAPIVNEIFNMYADGKTVKQIVNYLDSKQIRTSRGGKININAVQRILSNRRYIGEYKFRDIVVSDCIPPLVSKGLFDRVQEKLVKNKKAPATRKAEDEYLLTLKLFCGKCGAHMVGESGMGTSRVYRYYKCANTKKVHTCDKKPVRKEWIEDLAVKKATDILNDEKMISYLIDRIYILQGEENPRIPNLKAQLEDTQKRIANIMDAIEQGIITENTKSRLTQLESKQKELEIAILQEKIKKPFLTKEQIRFGIEKFRKLDISTQEGRQRLIDGFINSIYLFDDKLTITFNFKDGTQTVSLSELEAAKNSDIKCLGAPKTVKTKSVLTVFSMFFPVCRPLWRTAENFALSFSLRVCGSNRFAQIVRPLQGGVAGDFRGGVHAAAEHGARKTRLFKAVRPALHRFYGAFCGALLVLRRRRQKIDVAELIVGSVERVAAIEQGFQLPRNAVIVNGGRPDDDIRFPDGFGDFVRVVADGAFQRFAASHASLAEGDVFAFQRDRFHRVSCGFRAFGEGLRQHIGIAVRP